ncbi:hypothetical protein GBF38_015366 [Nibea albiflora]|uniref:Uncharacterized protein n=1 Tax=Nibea albiflora TaxID=240163 RepID=A0ACB7EKR9_NIBAL|nr:hypothetical protein GBF38_015366 [Nibea albiflora]
MIRSIAEPSTPRTRSCTPTAAAAAASVVDRPSPAATHESKRDQRGAALSCLYEDDWSSQEQASMNKEVEEESKAADPVNCKTWCSLALSVTQQEMMERE